MGDIANNLEKVLQNIHDAAKNAGRNPDEITLVAVTKTKTVEMVAEAIDAGQKVFGENYVNEAIGKIDHFKGQNLSWHFIGHLQTNKAKLVVPEFDMLQTVDRAKLANKIGTLAQNAGRILPVLVEVNVGGEQSKSGTEPEKAEQLVKLVCETPGLALRGLMTMPPFLPPEKVRPFFIQLRKLRDKLATTIGPGHSLDHLSMGMSGDYEMAISQGATIVRVGTNIFGAREYKK